MKFKILIAILGLVVTTILQYPSYCDGLNPAITMDKLTIQKLGDQKFVGAMLWTAGVYMTIVSKVLYRRALPFYFHVCLIGLQHMHDYLAGLTPKSPAMEVIKCSPELMDVILRIPVGEGIRVPITIYKVSNNAVVELITIPAAGEGANMALTIFTIIP